ncbi:MAG: DUF456 domain-containing protein [Candidatus Nanohalobium sp.]
MEPISVIVALLLLAGVAGSLLPVMPGALFSVSGIVIYCFYSAEPGPILTVFGLFTGFLALAADWFAGAVAADYGGASRKTSMAAAVTGLLGFIFLGGPLGLAVAVSLTVFVREYLIHGEREDSFRAAFYATAGVLGSAVIQVVLTGSILVAYLLTVVI